MDLNRNSNKIINMGKLKLSLNSLDVGKNRILLFLIISLGMFLRFYDLGGKPLWIDECLFAFMVKDGNYIQETIPVFIGHVLGLHSDFWLRSISAVCGTLTIPAVYFVVNKRKLSAALIVAIFPLFVFWSRMARPYAVAGLFVVLGWKYWWSYIPALLTTPISIVGIRLVNWNFSKQKKILLSISVLFVVAIIYLIRPDAGRNWSFQQVFLSSRWFYVPFITALLYVFDYLLPFLDGRFIKRSTPLVQPRGKFQRLEKRKKSRVLH